MDANLQMNTNKSIYQNKIRKFNKLYYLLIPILVLLLVLLFYPLISLLFQSFFDPDFTLDNYKRFFQETAYLNVLWNTIKTCIFITLITLLLGYPVSYVLVTVSDRLRNFLMVLVLLPFWTSFLVRTYAWIVILQQNGVVNQFLQSIGLIDEPIKLVHNTVGVYVGLIHILLPFMILALYGVMKSIDLELIKAACSLGATPTKAFFKVFLPLSIPGIAAGCLIVFIISIGYYVIPALLGGSKNTMISQLIAQQIGEQLNWGFGAAIAMVLLIVVLIILYLFNKFVGIDKISLGP